MQPKVPPNQGGAALVEFALLLPLLLMLVLGVADIGRAVAAKVVVQEAAQEGLSYVSGNPSDPSGARTRAVQASSQTWFTTADVAVTCPSLTQVTVTATASVSIVTPIISNIVGSSINISHSETAQVLSKLTNCTASP